MEVPNHAPSGDGKGPEHCLPVATPLSGSSGSRIAAGHQVQVTADAAWTGRSGLRWVPSHRESVALLRMRFSFTLAMEAGEFGKHVCCLKSFSICLHNELVLGVDSLGPGNSGLASVRRLVQAEGFLPEKVHWSRQWPAGAYERGPGRQDSLVPHQEASRGGARLAGRPP